MGQLGHRLAVQQKLGAAVGTHSGQHVQRAGACAEALLEARVDRALAPATRGEVVAQAARNLEGLLPAVSPINSRRFFFCSDDRDPTTLVEEGLDPGLLLREARDTPHGPSVLRRFGEIVRGE